MTETETWAADRLKRIVDNVLVAQIPEAPESEANSEARRLALALGLKRQANRHKASKTIPEAFGSSHLKGDELIVWQRYCPTIYLEGTPGFIEYSFDMIPLEVLRYWTELKEKYPFDTFEIWTTEKTRNNDLLLVGVYEGVRYLLARWGKEAPDPISFTEIRAKLCETLYQNFNLNELPEQVAKVIRDFHRESLGHVTRMEDWNEGRFFFKKHCGARMMAFSFGTSEVQGVCVRCGTQQNLGSVSYDNFDY